MSVFKIDFVGVGAGKSGTTWTHACLKEHPQVCMGRGKELNYFCKAHILDNVAKPGRIYNTAHYDLGIKWYESKFTHRENGQILGEISPTYIYDPETPIMLLDHNPDIKLIFNFRNPVDALYSAFFHAKQQHLPSDFTFEQYPKKYPRTLDYFSYAQHVKRYKEFFDDDSMIFIFMDDIRKDSHNIFNSLCNFLEIDDAYHPEALDHRVMGRKELRSYFIRDIFKKIADYSERKESADGIEWSPLKKKLFRFSVKILKMNGKPAKKVAMNPETRATLIDHFRKSNEELGDLLKRDLSHWNK